MLRSIEFENMKGQSNRQDLTGLDIFTGRNGSGKTTRIQSIGLAMLGYVPGQRKTAADTFKLATGDFMRVGLQIDGFQFNRKFEKTEKRDSKTGSISNPIKETLAVSPGKGERTETHKKDRISDEIGNFPVMLDFNEFLTLSDGKRRDFMYSLSPISSDSWTRERVQEYLENALLTHELEENNTEQYKAMQETLEEVMKEFPESYEIHDGLQSMLDFVSTQLSIWNAKKKDAQGAVRQLADLKNQIQETDRNIADNKKELEDLQKQLMEVEKKISADTEKKKAIDTRLKRIEELAKLIQEKKEEPIQVDVTELDKEIKEFQKQLVAEEDHTPKLSELKQKIETYRKDKSDLKPQQDQLERQIMQMQSGIDTLESSLNNINDLGGSCIIDKRIGCPKDFTQFKDFVKNKKAEADDAIAKVQVELDEIKLKRNGLEKSIEQLENEREAILTKSQQDSFRNQGLNKLIAENEKEREKRLTAAERRDNKIHVWEEERSRLTNHPAEPIGDISIMEKQAEGLRNRTEELKNSVAEKEKSKQTILLLQQSSLDNKKADYKATCFKLINEMLGAKGIQGELVKGILAPIKNDIFENLKLMGFDFEPFFQTESDSGKEVFQFGWINEKDHMVNFDALSTGQQTVFLAAMMMTIIERAQPQLKLLVMDNLNHLDSINFQLLIDGLSKIANKLDNIILAGAIEYSFEAERWKVWELDAQSKEEVRHEQIA
jgi:exonuclease SbcC